VRPPLQPWLVPSCATVQAGAHLLSPHTSPLPHSVSSMQLWQSCASAQTPLAQAVPSTLQPGTHVFLEPHTIPVGHVSWLGKQSTQVPSGKQSPLLQSGLEHCDAPAAPGEEAPASPAAPPSLLELEPEEPAEPACEVVPACEELPACEVLPACAAEPPAPPLVLPPEALSSFPDFTEHADPIHKPPKVKVLNSRKRCRIQTPMPRMIAPFAAAQTANS